MSLVRAPVFLSPDDHFLISHLVDLAMGDDFRVASSNFLTRREMLLASSELGRRGLAERLFFYGGHKDTLRKKAVFLPSWIDLTNAPSNVMSDEREDFLISVLREEIDGGEVQAIIQEVHLKGSGYRTLTHRDWLGGIMALGIKREALGDLILLGDSEAIVFASEKCVPVLLDGLRMVSTDAVQVAVQPTDYLSPLPRKYEDVIFTVASPRLDGVVHGLLHMARSEALLKIRRGEVLVNDTECDKPDFELWRQDILTIRGVGKFLIDSCDEETKKGRIRIRARKFV